ncbi:MAG TPA: M1 family aminopeptidase [Candidatus Angelobacter sp.]|jgi:ABC-type transport system involved in multi-copper enzyme maturation permease subunit|nr:M1 family aminopeptidase [Candidatus Angelobacter sp.]
MFWRIAWFEISYWLRSKMLWVFLGVIALAVFAAVSTPNFTLFITLTNTNHNAPWVISSYYSLLTLFMLLMAAAFVNSAALRDFRFDTNQIIFSTPMRRRDYLLGRFVGATFVSLIPMLGVSLGILAAKYMPWADPDQWGRVNWAAHWHAILVFALPNALIMAAILYAIAVLARNEVVPFIGAIVLLIGYITAGILLQDLRHEEYAIFADPFGIRTFTIVSKYWTVADKNSLPVSFSGLMLWNRLLWMAVALIIFVFSYFKFSFTEKASKATPVEPDSQAQPVAVGRPVPNVYKSRAAWAQALQSLRIHMRGMLVSIPFIVIMLIGGINCILALSFNGTEGYGNSRFPVTYWLVDLIRGSLYLFVVVIITFYAGVLVWKDKDERMDEIVDATPVPEWVLYATRLFTLLVMLLLIQAAALLAGIAVQAFHGYYRFQLGLYAYDLFVRDFSFLAFYSVLAFFIHVISPNKYVGYFGYVAFVVANLAIWRPLNIATNLVQFGGTPNVVHSDMFGDAPYRASWTWYTVYWLLFCGLLGILTVMFWPRGKQDNWRARRKNAALRYQGGWISASVLLGVLFAATGGWIWYNTEMINRVVGPKSLQRRQADYEKAYKQYEKAKQPRVRSVKYAIDIYPESRNIVMRGEQVIQNPFSEPLKEVHFTVDPNYLTDIDIPGASVSKDDEKLYYRIYKFDQPLQPNESRTMHFTVKSKNRGFENELSTVELVQDGTFFNNRIGPTIGYDTQRQLTDPNDRKKFGLKEIDLMPPLETNCTKDCMENYLGGHSDWVDVETVISTSPDQLAVAPGSLVREWRENGRNYFEYKLDHESLNFYSFISARYQVAREEWNGIKLEVYYDKQHPWNVPRMMNSVKKSLDYYTKNFGPYYHKEARIIEFPRVARFAQAFPGTMPYSEDIGFIANINKPDDIDFVFYVVAHEMGHQWWAHQVVGADMEGATLLSETMAQYSALMVMEKQYGRDMMRKFLKYEMDNYLRSRGTERLKERPLLTVEANQGYIHYRKGSVILYYLKEMIGEDAVNRALRKLIQQYAYAQPPYPTSHALVDALQEQTPPNLQYLIKDLFEDITVFSNRATEATAQKRADGKYEVTIKVEARKYKADAKGNETEVPVNDFIDIGAFAKPGKNKKYGDTLYRERVHMTQKESEFTFTTDKLPEKAGIDPFALLIDRVPDDNTKTVNLLGGTAAPKPMKAALQ